MTPPNPHLPPVPHRPPDPPGPTGPRAPGAAVGAAGPPGADRPAGLPGWWWPLLGRLATADRAFFTGLRPPASGGRTSAVLILLGGAGADTAAAATDRPPAVAAPTVGPADVLPTGVAPPAAAPVGGALPDVLLLERAADLRHHAGQPAFPGGASEPGDGGPTGTALREAQEEVGLDPTSVDVLATLPELWIPVSRFLVTPVLAWWRSPHPVRARQPAEVARVVRVPVAELVDPANRLLVRHPSGHTGPAFRVRGMLVWGFTGGVLSGLLDLAGWQLPWRDGAATVELPIAGDRPVP